MNLYRYLVVDAALNGTGVRTDYDSSDVELDKLGISEGLRTKIIGWLHRYQHQQFQGFEDVEIVGLLDLEGISIAQELKAELGQVKVSYYSEAQGRRFPVPEPTRQIP